MAIRTKQEILENFAKAVGDNQSDEIIALMEDISDTIDAGANSKINEEWDKKYRELDEAWRKKYKERFLMRISEDEYKEESNDDKEEIKTLDYDDLFEEG